MNRKKLSIGFASLVLILLGAVGGTLAWMSAASAPVFNSFTPAKVTTWVVEKVDGNVKSNVSIQNTGDVDAYIRAAVVVNLVNAEGNVSATVPVENTHYTITWDDSKWFKVEGYYYYPSRVEPTYTTGVLITSCQPKDIPEGWQLQVTILAEGVQADGTDPQSKKPAVNIAWGDKIQVASNGNLEEATNS